MNVSMNEYRTGNNQKETGKLLWHMHDTNFYNQKPCTVWERGINLV